MIFVNFECFLGSNVCVRGLLVRRGQVSGQTDWRKGLLTPAVGATAWTDGARCRSAQGARAHADLRPQDGRHLAERLIVLRGGMVGDRMLTEPNGIIDDRQFAGDVVAQFVTHGNLLIVLSTDCVCLPVVTPMYLLADCVS